ncbi:hypothetical protein [Adhaeribacter arboris]|nr:hypothetical protein [Adhaeribacter arboris]
MENLINKAIDKMKSNDAFKIYTASIWTDPNAAASSISFDSEENSILKVKSSDEFLKKHYDRLIAKGEFEEAQSFLPETRRNTNPADFELRDLVEISNLSFPINWEEESDGACWNELEPLLLKIGEQTFHRLQELNLHQEFKLAVNGPEDWYEHIWKKE